MKPFLLLLIASTALAEDPKPAATPVPAPAPKPTFFVVPSNATKTPEQLRAEHEAARKEADAILDAVQRQREAEALERIARALENRR